MWVDIEFLKHGKVHSVYYNTTAKCKHIWKSPFGDKVDIVLENPKHASSMKIIEARTAPPS